MVKGVTEIIQDHAIKEKCYSVGIHYGEIFSYLQNKIKDAGARTELNEKKEILRNIDLCRIHDLYAILKKNSDSLELHRKQRILEKLAESNGCIITEKGIYLDNK